MGETAKVMSDVAVNDNQILQIIKNGEITAKEKGNAIMAIALQIPDVKKAHLMRKVLLGNALKAEINYDHDLVQVFNDYKGKAFGVVIEGLSVLNEAGLIIKSAINHEVFTLSNVEVPDEQSITIMNQQKNIILNEFKRHGNNLKSLFKHLELIKIVGTNDGVVKIYHRTNPKSSWLLKSTFCNSCNQDFIITGQSHGLSGASNSIKESAFNFFYVTRNEKATHILLNENTVTSEGKLKENNRIFGELVF